MNINLIGAFVNVARAYEIAKVAGMQLVIVFPDMLQKPGEDTEIDAEQNFIEGDKEHLIYEFFTGEESPNGHIYVGVTRPSFTEITGKSESMPDIESRIIEAKMIIGSPEHDMTTGATALLKIAYEKLSLSIEDLYNIRKSAVAIAKLANTSKVCVEHYAEAIQYQSVPQHAKKTALDYLKSLK